MRTKSPLLLALLLAACATTTAPTSTGVWTNRAPRFDNEVAAFATQDAAAMPPRCATLFVGSSSIRMWPDLANAFAFPTIQRGVGGSTIAEIDSYFDRIVAPYQPARIVFYAGDNDINDGKPPAAVLDDLKRFMALKRQSIGATPVYFVSAKPSPSRIADLPNQREFNKLAAAYAAHERDLEYVDVATPMMDGAAPRADLFGPDNLHMVQSGYDIWIKTIGAALSAPASTRNPNCPS